MSNMMPVLYKRTSTGAIQEWQIEVDGDKYRTISGQQNGQKVTSKWTVAKGKNVGRSNETSPEEQAQLEADAKYTKKLAQGGYHESVDEIDNAKFYKPMLAKSFDDRPVTDFRNVWSQPKLDGVRCIANAEGLWTRQGKPIDAVPHIHEALATVFKVNPQAVLDGELYADKLSDDFNKIISLVRKKNPSEAHKAEAAGVVQYHIYDFPSIEGTFPERLAGLREVHDMTEDCIVLVESTIVEHEEHLNDLYSGYMMAGYEGQMVRLGDSYYEQKRSASLLKRKQFQDEEFTIISINEGIGNRSGIAGNITYELGDGRVFNSSIKGTHEYCKTLLEEADKYPGGQGTVRFQEYTPDGIPRFPVTVALYPDGRDS